MNHITADDFGVPVSIHSEHGLLHGQLSLLAEVSGIVVLAHAAMVLDEPDALMAAQFRQAGFSTLSVDLLARQEEHFPDVHNNVSLLAKRLLEFIDLIKNRMLLGEIPTQALGLCAAGVTSPVAVRVAAQRDLEVAAVVCRGGLIDLAGALYLHSLTSPLLVLAEETDTHHIAISRRALQEISCPCELKLIPQISFDFSLSDGFEKACDESIQWFRKYLQTA